jgi:hypothetical protein
MKKFVVFLAFVCVLAPVQSGEPEKRAETIAPFLDEQAYAVVRVDLAGADVDAILKKIADLGIPMKDVDRAQIKHWHGEILKAGAREAYLVWSMADALGEPFAVIPAKGEDEARTLAGAIKPFLVLDSRTVGGVVLVGSKGAITRLGQVKAASFPDLTKAFSAAGEATFQAVVIPPITVRRAVKELIPNLPAQFGDVPVSVVDKGVVWIALGVNIAPKMSVNYVIKSRDAAAAKDLAKLADTFIQSLAIASDVRESPQWLKVVPRLIPKARADRVVLALDDETVTKLLLPALDKVKDSSGRMQSVNNLKQMGLAMHNYADTFKSLPAYASFDKDGKPLLSWRVHLLPFLDQDALYKEFHLDEPWDSEHNKALIARIPPVYRSPLAKKAGPGKTIYQVPLGKHALFGGKKELNFPRDVPDGTSNTIMVVETSDDNAVIWTKPADFKSDVENPLKGLLRPGAKGFHVGMADGSVRVISSQVTLATLRAAFTRDGGEVLGSDF